MKGNDNRTNWFDDGILDDDRVRRVIRGRLAATWSKMISSPRKNN